MKIEILSLVEHANSNRNISWFYILLGFNFVPRNMRWQTKHVKNIIKYGHWKHGILIIATLNLYFKQNSTNISLNYHTKS